jgi:protease YdgD
MVGALSRGLALLVAFAVGMPMAHGAASGPVALHQEDVDQSRYPWSAIGKVTNSTGAECSGVMVASDKVLTAAHCLYNYRGLRFVAPDSIHFLLGYRGGRYSAHARVASYEIGLGFDPQRYQETFDADWALLSLTENLPQAFEPLKLTRESTPIGTKAMLAGYPQDRAEALTADRDCELRERINQGRLVVHTCRSAKGTSGGPILIRSGDGEIRMAGIQVATLRGAGFERMVAVPVQALWQKQPDGGRAQKVAELIGEEADRACAEGNAGAVARLESIGDRLGLDPVQLAFADVGAKDVSSLGEPEPSASNVVMWVMAERFVFALQ